MTSQMGNAPAPRRTWRRRLRWPAAGLGVLILALVVVAARRLRDRKALLYGSIGAGVLVLAQAALGGLTVEEGLHEYLVAAHLGLAMQLTNVCRDVREDWQRGRLYLPDELLARHGAGGLCSELGKPFPVAAAPA